MIPITVLAVQHIRGAIYKAGIERLRRLHGKNPLSADSIGVVNGFEPLSWDDKARSGVILAGMERRALGSANRRAGGRTWDRAEAMQE